MRCVGADGSERASSGISFYLLCVCQTAYVSESMYLVMENPVSRLHVGEVVYFKVHALCDKSASGLAGVSTSAASRTNSSSSGATTGTRESKHGTLFLTNLRVLFLAFERGGNHHSSRSSAARGVAAARQEVLEVPLNNIAELAEFRASSSSTMASQLEISCKNFEIVKFNFPCDSTSGCVAPTVVCTRSVTPKEVRN